MQDEFSSTRPGLKTKKTGNGKWVPRQDAEMDNEAATPSTLASSTSSTPSLTEDTAISSTGVGDFMSTARTAFDGAVSKGSDLLKNVDLSRGTGVIRDYPIQAAVGGLIVGFLLGAAVFSRRAE